MGILNKIVTAIRGGAREAGEAIVDANALRILDQEVHDAKNEIRRAEQSLASLVADQEAARAKYESAQRKIEEHEGYIAQALEKGDEALAVEIAERVGQFEEEHAYEKGVYDDLVEKISQQKSFLKNAQRKVESLERDAKMVKTTERVQRTTASLNSSFNSGESKVGRASESLQRLKERQERRSAEMKAAEQLQKERTGADLDDKLRAAGIKTGGGSKANDILARVKAKSAS